jgi:hypothetical protein
MNWRDFDAAAPELAGQGMSRFESVGIALLGSLRRDGSPRISVVEPRFIGGQLLVGLGSGTTKADDLLRDPRCALHSAVADPLAEGEFKVDGTAELLEPAAAASARDADEWWASQPADAYRLFAIDVKGAVSITWDVERGTTTVTRWTPAGGVRRASHPYP